MKTDKKTVSQYADGSCPDAETVEKYCEATITLVEMQDVKEHLDVCQVCWMTAQAWAGEQARKHLKVVK